MRLSWGGPIVLGLAVAWSLPLVPGHSQTKTENAKGDKVPPGTVFRTSDRCVACHNGLKTREGEDISIGLDWSANIIAKY